MSERRENIGHREDLRSRRKLVAAEVQALRDSIRAALPVVNEAHEVDGDHVLSLALSMKEKLDELAGLDRKIAILTRELDG
ncbi:MAG: hypothetical protein RBR41_14365 [Desulfovibrio sp.]|jgi:hypothetical protein|uniref:hypothetical protein n=1 Tax=Desulfovibrio sp. TaxID=885 RepID=UPI002A36E63C|nr:hypothetical protein [Desulfovibrio sp.]MDY0260834.1 hypothetical protein [Desulfovibrio sp.]